MFKATISGKIFSVKEAPITNTDYPLSAYVEEVVFIDRVMLKRIWHIHVPAFKEKWVRKLAEKKYTVVIELSNIIGMIEPSPSNQDKIHAEAILSECHNL